MTHKGSDHSLSRMAIPPFRTRRHSRRTEQTKLCENVGGVRDKTVGPFGDSDGSLRIRTDRETRNAECRGFLLQTTRIGDHSESMFDQIEHFEITDRLEHPDSIHFEARCFEA